MGNGTSNDRVSLEFDMCPNEALVDLSAMELSFDIYFQTTSGSPFNEGDMWFINNGSSVILACTPILFSANQWTHVTCSSFSSATSHIQLVARINSPWTGTVYIDNVQFGTQ